jgi:predicted DNA binding CopG/RHH family protein
MEAIINLKLPSVLKEQLKKEAHEKGLTLSGYIKAILAERKK